MRRGATTQRSFVGYNACMGPVAFLARSLPIGVAALLMACSLAGPASGPNAPRASVRARVKSPAPAPVAKAGVSAKLLKPAQGTKALVGQVNIEASYALRQGGLLVGDAAGDLIGDKGGGLIGKVKLIGDGTSSLIGKVKAPLIGDMGGEGGLGEAGAAIGVGGIQVVEGRIVSNNGGSVIADASGNVIASLTGGAAAALADGTLLAGSGLIGDAGSGLIGDAGSGLIGDAGSGLIGDAGSGIISNGGASLTGQPGPAAARARGYRLAQAADGVGVALPAAGMVVGVISLATREYLPIGETADGKPVYGVYSDVNGRFEVHVPEAEQGNVLVVASVPGSRDPRGTYDLVAADRSQPFAVDDLGRLTARYIRRTFTGRLAATIKSPEISLLLLDRELTWGGSPEQPGTAKGDVKRLIDLMVALGRETGIGPETPDAVLTRKAQRLIDLALARIDLQGLQITAEDVATWTDDVGLRPPYPVLDAYRAGLIVLLDGATKQLRAEPGFFTQDYLATVINASDGGSDAPPLTQDWTGRVVTPADVGEFMMVEYFGAVRANATTPTTRMYEVFHKARGDAAPADAALESTKVLSSTLTATSVAIARVLIREDLRAEVQAILAAPDQSPAPAPAP